jgi:hypothetical protein
MISQPSDDTTMPQDIRRAISDAVDRLTRAREVPRVEAKPARRQGYRRVVIPRRAKQKMMDLLKLASCAAAGRVARGNGTQAVWSWVQQLGLGAGAESLIDALTRNFNRLSIDQASAAPAGAVIVLGGTAAVKGFGLRYYSDGELLDLPQDVLGIYVPR